MHFTKAAKSTLKYLLKLDVPESAYIDVDTDGYIAAQCPTQAAVREFRAAFGGGVVWTKAYDEAMQWWTYDATLPSDIQMHVYACKEAPPMCKAIVEEIEVEEKVPMKWVTKVVKKKRARWECGGDEEGKPHPLGVGVEDIR